MANLRLPGALFANNVRIHYGTQLMPPVGFCQNIGVTDIFVLTNDFCYHIKCVTFLSARCHYL
jgi:hypothetical protein